MSLLVECLQGLYFYFLIEVFLLLKIRGWKKNLILSIIAELNIKSYQKLRECGWKHRQKTLHIIPETKY